MNHVACIIDQHFTVKSRQTTIRDYIPIYLEIRVHKKVLLKEEILLHYQNSWFFWIYTNSIKISGPLPVRINGCMLYLFNVDTSFALLKNFYVLQNCDQKRNIYIYTYIYIYIYIHIYIFNEAFLHNDVTLIKLY